MKQALSLFEMVVFGWKALLIFPEIRRLQLPDFRCPERPTSLPTLTFTSSKISKRLSICQTQDLSLWERVLRSSHLCHKVVVLASHEFDSAIPHFFPGLTSNNAASATRFQLVNTFQTGIFSIFPSGFSMNVKCPTGYRCVSGGWVRGP